MKNRHTLPRRHGLRGNFYENIPFSTIFFRKKACFFMALVLHYGVVRYVYVRVDFAVRSFSWAKSEA